MRRTILIIFVILLAALLIVQAAFSLQWPIAHDEAPLFYEAFLMQSEDRIPYRDIFDFQMPGSFAAYSVLGFLSGFSALRIRILDLVLLTALLTITFFSMRRFGKITAITAGILFGLKYLQGGPSMSLQREYLLLLFIALAVYITMRDDLTLKHRLAIGFFFGLAATLKPHAAIGLIPILLFDMSDMVKRFKLTLLDAAKASILPTVAGFLIPILIMIVWLAVTGALTPFINIAINYWPLYSQIDGQMAMNTGLGRIPFLLNQFFRLGGNALWIIPALIGIYLNQSKRVYLLASLVLCYAIYPALSGQFFEYHYVPFLYFIILLASLSLSTVDLRPLTFISSFTLLVVILLTIRPSTAFLRQLEGKPIFIAASRADEISHFLEKNLEEGDTVQPLDWTGGTLLAMLETRAHIATPYIFDFYFYHHISTPYIQSLRADFINDLKLANPNFIIEVTAIDKPWVSGINTSREFPELRVFLTENYSVTIQKDDYVIYELQQ
ncbi:MAG: hypothetical protein H7Y59_13180 [Anaerolineales bacterium]|nr:hypothetical protein [Anaerolineales bacterium]